MIQHSYVGHGQIDHQALEAAKARAVYYGAAGFVDPRTYTLDVYAIRRLEKQPWKATVRLSLQAAGYGAAFGAAMGYMGIDPLNVTPEYGISPSGGVMTVDDEPMDYRRHLLDWRQVYM